MVEQEDREVKPHQKEMEVANLSVGEERKEVKVDTGMSEMNCVSVTRLPRHLCLALPRYAWFEFRHRTT